MTASMVSIDDSMASLISEIKNELEVENTLKLKKHFRNILTFTNCYEALAHEVSSVLKRTNMDTVYIWRNRNKLNKIENTAISLLKRFFLTLNWVHTKQTVIPKTGEIKNLESASIPDLMQNFFPLTLLFPNNGYSNYCPEQQSLGTWHWILCSTCSACKPDGDILGYGAGERINDEFTKLCRDEDFEQKLLQVKNWTWFQPGGSMQLFLAGDGKLIEGGNISSMERIIEITKNVFMMWNRTGQDASVHMLSELMLKRLQWNKLNARGDTDEDWDCGEEEERENYRLTEHFERSSNISQ